MVEKFNKSLIIYTSIFSMMFANNSFADIKQEPIKLKVNQAIVNTDVPPVIIDGSVLVPARTVFEEVGATVLWIKETQEIFITLNNSILILKVDNNTADLNGSTKTMDVPPKIINNSVMIPLRFVAEALNFKIGWNEKERIASVDSTPQEIVVVVPETEVFESGNNSDITQKPTQIESIEKPTQIEPIETPTQKEPIETPTQGMNGEIVRFKAKSTYSSNNSGNIPIIQENNATVNIISVDLPKSGDEIFKIGASGRISSVSYGMLQDPIRLYVDIENSISELDANISSVGSNVVTAIRTAQQAEKVSRVVFDIPSGQNYDVYLSEDRTAVNVKFKPIEVEEVTFQRTVGQDIINIYANGIFKPVITQSSNPNTMTIDVPNSISTIGENATNVVGNMVSAVRTSQFNSNTVRLVFDTKKLVDYEVSSNELCTTIKITEPTYENISYENSNNPRILLKKDNNYNIDINSIKHSDKYLEGYYKITLANDYSNLFGHGEYKINDTYLKSVSIKNNNGSTELTFNQKDVYAYTITEDTQNIYINILNPKQVYKNVVVIDAGHGGAAPGNVNSGLTEKVITLDVSNRLYLLLEADPNIKAYATRTTDVDTPWLERTGLPNHLADMFVSIHCNSLASTSKNYTSVSGVQVLHPNPSDSRGAMSEKMAAIFRETVSTSLDIPIRPADQTIGYDKWVLRKTTIPACLIEMGFLTNAVDAAKLASADGRQAAAQGIYEGIKKSFSTLIQTGR